MEEPILNAHSKDEFAPSHTAEHLLNATMVKMFGCPRSRNAHVERKKCKCDYILAECPGDSQITESTREERLEFVRSEFKCIGSCRLCGNGVFLRGKEAEEECADYIEGMRDYMAITNEYRDNR